MRTRSDCGSESEPESGEEDAVSAVQAAGEDAAAAAKDDAKGEGEVKEGEEQVAAVELEMAVAWGIAALCAADRSSAQRAAARKRCAARLAARRALAAHARHSSLPACIAAAPSGAVAVVADAVSDACADWRRRAR